MQKDCSKPLSICLVSYRSNPHCGGQGVYIRNLSRALKDLGHHVEVLAGPPDPMLDEDMDLTMLKTLDLYNPDDLFRTPSFEELKEPINFMEWFGVSTMGYPEPFTFGLRAYQYLRKNFHKYDIIHDNQSLSYGIWAAGNVIPTVATIHHPITIDRQIAVRNEKSLFRKMKWMRWYSFIGMQKRVARRLPKIITVSECSRQDIHEEFSLPRERFSVVPNGINTELFYPVPEIQRQPDRLIVTNSADTPLKGLKYLLHAVSAISKKRSIKLTVIGTPKKNGEIARLVGKLSLENIVNFTGRITNEEFVKRYAESSIAVVPSIYEGYGLPVGEAMATGIPVICTSGGALPEVAGDAAVIVPPGDAGALEKAILHFLDNPDIAAKYGSAGYERVTGQLTWKQAAEKTAAVYREVIRDHNRL